MYDQIDFLEFFNEEKIIDPEVRSIEYTLYANHDFIFTLYIHVFEEFASINVTHKQSKSVLFDIGLDNVDRIALDKQKAGVVFLNFYKENAHDSFFSVQLNPAIHVHYTIV